MNQCWFHSLTHICSIRERWVNDVWDLGCTIYTSNSKWGHMVWELLRNEDLAICICICYCISRLKIGSYYATSFERSHFRTYSIQNYLIHTQVTRECDLVMHMALQIQLNILSADDFICFHVAPSNCVSQCWLIIISVPQNTSQCIFKGSSY